MTKTFHLAVLETDTPFPAVQAVRGSYGDIFQDLFSRALEAAGLKDDVVIQVSKWDVVSERNYPQMQDVDGILLTGSRATAYVDDGWNLPLVEYVKSFLTETQKPVIGLCYGHQTIARALGAKVDVNPGGWELGVLEMHLSEVGKELFGVETLNIHQMHRDAVLEVPRGTINLASSPRCEIQGLYQPGRIFSLQGHPEFDELVTGEFLRTHRESRNFSEELYNEGQERLRKDHDGIPIAIQMCKFLLATME